MTCDLHMSKSWRKNEAFLSSAKVEDSVCLFWWLRLQVEVNTRAPSLTCVQLCVTPPVSSVHGILQARNTAVGCHFLRQGIFPTLGSNPPFVSPVRAAGFFTTRGTWQAPKLSKANILGFGPQSMVSEPAALEFCWGVNLKVASQIVNQNVQFSEIAKGWPAHS